jgi:D-alanyl-D-alanine carboxypeptidase
MDGLGRIGPAGPIVSPRSTALIALALALAAPACTDPGAATDATSAATTGATAVEATADEPAGSPAPTAGSDVGAFELSADPELTAAAVALRGGADGALLLSVTRPDRTVVYGTDGLAGGDPLLPDTPIRVGSVTKTFVAVKTLQLVEEGAFTLDDEVAGLIGRVNVPGGITVRHLLGQASGLPSFIELVPDLVSDPARVWTPEEILMPALGAPANFSPGDRFEYSDTNFILLGVLVEEATGQELAETLKDTIIDPLGLEHTFLGRPGDEGSTVPAAGQGEAPYTAIVSAAWATGGLVSDAVDLHVFMSALFGGALIGSESLDAMTSGVVDGYGLGIYDMGDGRYGHGGGLPGYRVQMTYDTSSGATAFAATNNGDEVDFSTAETDLYALARRG